MRFSRFSSALFIPALAAAITEEFLPPNVKTDFSDTLEVQASFTNTPSNGFEDGLTISKTEAQATPKFALGDASGLNSQLIYAMLMIDVSCEQPTLHYAQSGFQLDGTKTQIASQTAPVLSYVGPGTFGETGNRQYVFLMYIQENDNAPLTNLPAKGDAFDVNGFASQNNLGDVRAATGFKTELGGSTSCGTSTGGGSGGSGGGNSPPPEPSSPPETSTPPEPIPPPQPNTPPAVTPSEPPVVSYTPPVIPPSNSTVAPPPVPVPSTNTTKPPSGPGGFTTTQRPTVINSTWTAGGSTATSVTVVTGGGSNNGTPATTGAPGSSTTPTAAAMAVDVDTTLMAAIGLGLLGALI